MKDFTAPITVSALIVTRKNLTGQTEILNVLAHNKDRYGFPGGKLNDGETPEQAVIRETEEELGVTPTKVTYQATYEALTTEGRPIKMFVFTGEVQQHMIAPTNEISELHWLSYDEMVERLDLLTPMTVKHALPLIEKL